MVYKKVKMTCDCDIPALQMPLELFNKLWDTGSCV